MIMMVKLQMRVIYALLALLAFPPGIAQESPGGVLLDKVEVVADGEAILKSEIDLHLDLRGPGLRPSPGQSRREALIEDMV